MSNTLNPKCKHLSITSQITFARLVEKEHPPDFEDYEADAFAAQITINCEQCGIPFEFIGIRKSGFSVLEPMVSPHALELRVPIKPQGITKPATLIEGKFR